MRREEAHVTGNGHAPQVPAPKTRFFNPSLLAAVAALALWVVLAFLVRIPSGWVHLPLAVGVLLLVRRVVTGPREW